MRYTLSNKKSVQYVLAVLKQWSIRQIVLSPGSRNAPFLISFPEDKDFELYSIVDERSAAFFALGLALRSGQPVVLNCTSGSALLNYAPALAEAYYQQVPLVVISADRPKDLIDRGYGQCIHQVEALKGLVKAQLNLPEAAFDTPELAVQNVQRLQSLLQEAIWPVPGPVHINMPLVEPLYEKEKVQYPHVLPWTLETYSETEQLPLLEAFLSDFQCHNKKLVLVGQMPIEEQGLLPFLESLFKRQDVFIMGETLANVGFNYPAHIDPLLTLTYNQDELSDYAPDMVISIGGHLVSKQIKRWLSGLDFSHWQLSYGQHRRDTFFKDVQCLSMPLKAIHRRLLSCYQPWGNYREQWNRLEQSFKSLHQHYVAQVSFSDFSVYAHIICFMQQLDQCYDVHMANSTAIRYAQLFSWDNNKVRMFSNRGVSGLEGSLSTAIGASQKSPHVSCCFLGDLAFFYDSSALWNSYRYSNIKIILVHNGGGGIFRFIDGPADSEHLEWFETPHQRSAAHLAKDAGVLYFCANSTQTLKAVLPTFFNTSDQACLLEICTPQQSNAEVLKKYFSGFKM